MPGGPVAQPWFDPVPGVNPVPEAQPSGQSAGDVLPNWSTAVSWWSAVATGVAPAESEAAGSGVLAELGSLDGLDIAQDTAGGVGSVHDTLTGAAATAAAVGSAAAEAQPKPALALRNALRIVARSDGDSDSRFAGLPEITLAGNEGPDSAFGMLLVLSLALSAAALAARALEPQPVLVSSRYGGR